MALFGGIELPGRPDLTNIRKLDLLPIPMLRRMMRGGIAIDREYAYNLSSEFAAEMRDLERNISSYIPPDRLHEFSARSEAIEEEQGPAALNPRSAEQIGALLWDMLGIGGGISNLKRTGQGKVSTGKKNLELVKNQHPVVPIILRHREVSKLKGTYCVAPDSQVLTNDLCWRNAGDVSVGDKLLAFDKYPSSNRGLWRKWRPTAVTQVNNLVLPCYRLCLSDGTEIVCSEDHQWLARNNSKSKLEWTRTDDLLACDRPNSRVKLSKKLVRALPIWKSRKDFNAGYISGSLDSEGYLSYYTGTYAFRVAYAQKPGPVFDKVHNLLLANGFHPSVSLRTSAGNGRLNAADYLSIGISKECLRLLGEFRPIRILKKFVELPSLPNINLAESLDVVNREFVGLREVVSITTESGTLIVNGIASHNCDKMPALAKFHPRSECCPICELRHAADTWRVHGELGTTRADTGRINHKNPNLGNVPTRTDDGQRVQAMFIASPGKKIVARDLSQIELRDLAHLAICAAMIATYAVDGDIHDMTARKVFNLPETEKPDKVKHRMAAKRVSFGIMNGSTERGLFMQLVMDYGINGIPVPDWLTLEWCKWFINEFLEAYPEIREYFARMWYRARRYEMAWDSFGRVKLIPEVRSTHQWIKESGLRQAQNMPITSCAAGQLKLAMGKAEVLSQRLLKAGIWNWPLMTIHDSLMFEVDEDYAEDVLEELGGAMDSVMDDEQTGKLMFRVPIKSDGSVMERWVK